MKSFFGTRPYRLTALICGLLCFTSNVTYADTNSALDKLMGQAISQAQGMVSLMTQNCPGGRSGQNPLAYEPFVANSNQVGQKLVDLRLALARGQPTNAGPEIDSIVALLGKMVAMMHENCPGGSSGINPLNYGELVNVKNRVEGKLEAVKTLLTN